jgi:hypothetical protein
MLPYPAMFDVASPARYDRVQVVMRLLFAVMLGLLGVSFGWVMVLLYFALPAIAAVVIQSRGVDSYLEETAPSIQRLLRWLLSLMAYMVFLTDRFPTGGETLVSYEVTPGGAPTVQSALWRLLASLPEALVLALLGVVSTVLALLSALQVLFVESVPETYLGFQRAVIRWQGRLFAYHASLVEVMPPFALDSGREAPRVG